MIHVEEVNDIRQLAGCRLLWKALLPQTRGATFFQSLDWLEVYWKHHGGDQRLRVLMASRDGEPLGILPLVVRTESTRVGRLRVLTYPLDDWGTFYGQIGPNPAATLAAAMRYLRETPRDYDLLDLRWIDLDGCDHGRTEAAMRRVGFSPRKQAWNTAVVVDIQGAWEDYWNARAKKWQDNLRRLERRLIERGEVTFVRYRPDGAAYGDADPRWDLYDACVGLAQSSWQGASQDGTTLSHASVSEYLRETHVAAARAGALDLTLLLLDDRPAAFAYNYHYRGRIHGLRKGYDPDFAALSPGCVLEYRMLQDSFQRGDCHHDMGTGSLDRKRYWQTSRVTSYRCTHFPATIGRAQLLRMKRWLADRLHANKCAAGA